MTLVRPRRSVSNIALVAEVGHFQIHEKIMISQDLRRIATGGLRRVLHI